MSRTAVLAMIRKAVLRTRRTTALGIAVALLAGLFQVAASLADTAPVELVPPGDARFDRPFFGMHFHDNNRRHEWPDLPIGSLRLWDAYLGWNHLEPRQGTWDFTALDRYVDWANDHAVEVDYPLGVTPRWASSRPDEPGAYGPGTSAEPRDDSLWRAYVRAVVTRYRGRIRAYEIWNEVNIRNFFTGAPPTLRRLVAIAAEEIHKADPAALLVAPSAVGFDDAALDWPAQLLTTDLRGQVDVVAFHLYHAGLPPEVMVDRLPRLLAALRAAGLDGKPLWNTESGHWTPNDSVRWGEGELASRIPIGRAATYVPREMLLARALGFERFFWYAWDNPWLGFIDGAGGAHRQNAEVLTQFIDSLLRARLERCRRSASGVWTCALRGGNSHRLEAVWTDPQAVPPTRALPVPGARRVQVLDGRDAWHAAGAEILAGPVVTLIDYGP